MLFHTIYLTSRNFFFKTLSQFFNNIYKLLLSDKFLNLTLDISNKAYPKET